MGNVMYAILMENKISMEAAINLVFGQDVVVSFNFLKIAISRPMFCNFFTR